MAIGRTGEALACASLAALLAVAWPPASLLMIAFLAARALMNAWSLPRVVDIAAPIGAAIAVGASLGLAAGIGMVFVWRVIADAMWSWREEARLSAIAGRSQPLHARAHLLLTPLLGLIMVAYTAPHMVAGLPLDLPHLPAWVPAIVALVTGVALFDWAVRCAADWRLGTIAPAPIAHQVAHHAIFLIAYASTQDISAGLVAFVAWRLAYAQPRGALVAAEA